VCCVCVCFISRACGEQGKMPVTPEWSWEETDTVVSVVVKLPGLVSKRPDVTVADAYLKVNAAPYLFAADLRHDVDSDASEVRVGSGEVTFSLTKKEAGVVWGGLGLKKGEDGWTKEALWERREKSVGEAMERATKRQEEAKREKDRLDKEAVGVQMAIDSGVRESVDARRAAALAEQTADIMAWKASGAKTRNRVQPGVRKGVRFEEEEDVVGGEGGPRLVEISDEDSDDEGEDEGERLREEVYGKPQAEPAAAPDLHEASADVTGKLSLVSVGSEDSEGEYGDEEEEDEEEGEGLTMGDYAGGRVPQLNTGGEIWDLEAEDGEDAGSARPQLVDVRPKLLPVRDSGGPTAVSFTWRPEKTPARESTAKQESEYRRALGVNAPGKGDTADVSERDPRMLKERADKFFKGKDFASAIIAYTEALAGSRGELVAALTNRAAAYLQVGEYAKAAEDCTAGLAKLEAREQAKREAEGRDMVSSAEDSGEAVATRAKQVKLLVRRAMAEAKMGQLAEAADDYERALVLDPRNEKLGKDLREVRACMEAPTPESLKARGDGLFRDGEHARGALAYSEALLLLEAALDRVDGEGGGEREGMRALQLSCHSNRAACRFASGEFAGCVEDCGVALGMLESGGEVLDERRKATLVRVVTRRGAAHAHLKAYAAAEQDYCRAVELSPGDAKLKADLDMVVSKARGEAL